MQTIKDGWRIGFATSEIAVDNADIILSQLMGARVTLISITEEEI
jgi:hypothetical protein